METPKYTEVVAAILTEFPEYKVSSRYFDNSSLDLPYVALGNLCLMAFENLDQQQDVALAERLVRLTDQILNDPTSEKELVNLFQIEVFEKLVACRTGAVLAKKYLHGKSLAHLEQTLEHFGAEAFLKEYRAQ